MSVWLHSTLLVVRGSFLCFLSFFLSSQWIHSFVPPKKKKKIEMFSSWMIALICSRCSPLVNYLYLLHTSQAQKHLKHAKFKSYKRAPRSKWFESRKLLRGWAKLWIYFRLLGFDLTFYLKIWWILSLDL